MKQRKYRFKSPLNIKQKLAHSHLSKELRKKHGKRSIGLRKGDKVMIIAGKFRKKEGKVENIDLKSLRVFISGVELPKKDGSKLHVPLHPSNLMILELNMDDKLRQGILGRK